MTQGPSRPKLALPNLGPVLTIAQIVSTVANINWKGLRPMGGLVKEYWGRIILVGIASVVIGFVLYDWRAVTHEKELVVNELVAAQATIRVLEREKAAELEARAVRAEQLAKLSEEQVAALAEVKEILDENKDWANQPIPPALAERLRR